MKNIGNVQGTANIIYGQQIYQSTSAANVVSTNTANIDCNKGNIQSLDLAAATGDVTVTISNYMVGSYILAVKQHPTTVRKITFSPTVNTQWDIQSIGVSGFAVIVMHYDGTTFTSNSTTSEIRPFSPTDNYGIGALVTNNGGLYASNVQISAGAFNASLWDSIGASTAAQATYDDTTHSTGNTNVQTVIDFILAKPNLELKKYADIAAMIADTTNHTDSTLCLVTDASVGAITDSSRAGAGYAYYIKNRVGTTIAEYDVLGQLTSTATRSSYDNSVSLIPNGPTNVQKAIEELKLLVDDSGAGQKLINVWDASTNVNFIADNGYYDSGVKNPTIDNWAAGTNTAKVLDTDVPTALTVGAAVRVVHPTTGATILDTTVTAINDLAGVNTELVLASNVGVLQGHKILTADTKADVGDYFSVSVTGTTTIDGVSTWDLGNKIQSNGTTWLRIQSASGLADAPADGKTYGRKDNTWEEVSQTIPALAQVLTSGSLAANQSIGQLGSLATRNVSGNYFALAPTALTAYSTGHNTRYQNANIVYATSASDQITLEFPTTDMQATPAGAKTISFKYGSGTVAFTSDVDTRVPYTGATGNVNLGGYHIAGGSLFVSANKAHIRGYMVDSTTSLPVLQQQVEYWTGAAFSPTEGYGVGIGALAKNTGPNSNAFGAHALGDNTGSWGTAFGHWAGRNATGNFGIYVGPFAGRNNSGTNNVLIGYQAGQTNTGSAVTATGYQAGITNTGNGLTAYGSLAGMNNIGNDVTAIGTNAALSNNAPNVTAVGQSAGFANTGSNSTMVGNAAGASNTGQESTFVGRGVGQNNTGIAVTGIGYDTLRDNTGSYSVGVGYQSLQNNAGGFSTAVGPYAGQNNTGVSVTAVGYNSATSNSGASAAFFGAYSGQYSNASNSVGIGISALQRNTGNASTALGAYSAQYNRGSNIVALGFGAGQRNTGANTISIGTDSNKYNTNDDVISIGNTTNNAFVNDTANEKTFDTSADVISASNQITIPAHGFGATNEIVNLRYLAVSGSNPTGMSTNQIYMFNIVDANTLAIQFIGISAAASGSGKLVPQFIYTNTVNIGHNVQPTADGRITIGTSVNYNEVYSPLPYKSDILPAAITHPKHLVTLEYMQANGGVPYTGATGDVNLGDNHLQASEVFEVTNKSRFYRSIRSNNANILMDQFQYWNGAAFATSNGIAVGRDAMINSEGRNGTALGVSALGANTGDDSTGIGYLAGQNNTGASGVFVGQSAGINNTGSQVVGIGVNAAFNNTGVNSVAVGQAALFGNTGLGSIGIGISAGQNNTGSNLNAFGSSAGYNNTGINLIAIGENAGQSNTGHFSISIGASAGYNNTATNAFLGGRFAGQYNKGANVLGIGTNALQRNAGGNTIGLGVNAAANNIASNAVGVGDSTLLYNIGQYNTAVGHQAFNQPIVDAPSAKNIANNATDINTASDQLTITAHGFGAPIDEILLQYTTTGTTIGGLSNNGIYRLKVIDANTLEFIGRSITSLGSGIHTFTGLTNISNSSAVGYNAQATKSDQVVLGASSVTEVYSDAVFKSNVAIAGITDPKHLITLEYMQSNGGVPYVGATAALQIGNHAIISDRIEEVTGIARHYVPMQLDTTSPVPIYRIQTEEFTGSWNTVNAIGFGVGSIENNKGDSVSAFGFNAARSNSGDEGTFIGYQAGMSNNQTRVTAIGHEAARDNTGNNATAVGYRALRANNTFQNTGIGSRAGENNTGWASVFTGYVAGQNNTGDQVVAIGNESGRNNTGSRSVLIGYWAGRDNTGTQVTAVGRYAGLSNTGDLTALGSSAGSSNSGAQGVVAVGGFALSSNTQSFAIGVGRSAGQTNKGARVQFIGDLAGNKNQLSDNTGIGNWSHRYSGASHSVGIGNMTFIYGMGNGNTAIGSGAWSIYSDDVPNSKTVTNNVTDVNVAANRITITAHGFGANGQTIPLKYTVSGGSAISGLTIYRTGHLNPNMATIIDANTLEFPFIGNQGGATPATTHTFTPQTNNYSNSTVIGFNSNPSASNQVTLGDTNIDEVLSTGVFRSTAPMLSQTDGDQLTTREYIESRTAYFTDRTVSTTSLVANQSKLLANYTANFAGDREIEVSYRWTYDNATNDFVSVVHLDGVQLESEHRQEPKDPGGTGANGEGTDQSMYIVRKFYIPAMTAGAHTIELFYAAGSVGVTASIGEVMIKVVTV